MNKEQMLKEWDKRIKSIAWNYKVPGMEWEDIIQELRWLLCKCIDRYDPNKGVQFNTYFYHCARTHCHQLYEGATRLKRKGQTIPLVDAMCYHCYDDVELGATIQCHPSLSMEDKVVLQDYIEGKEIPMARLRKINKRALEGILGRD